jgi:3-oxoacyl-[acyl-carrier-protein] synthase III
MTTVSTRITSLQALALSVEAARDVLAQCRSATELVDLVTCATLTRASEQVVRDAREITLWAARR